MNLLPGVQRMYSGSTIVVGVAGSPKRIFSVHAVPIAGTTTSLVFNCDQCGPMMRIDCNTGTLFATQGTTVNIENGMRFVGCTVTTDSNLNWASIVYTEEF